MRIERVTVNKQMAQDWLERNIDRNRTISRQRVRRLAGDMTARRWKRTGETIKFDRTGRLVDGQHRLSAVIEADMPVEFDVAYDVAEDAVTAIDQGRARSAKDVFHMAGEVSAKVMAASAKISINYLEGYNPNYSRTTQQLIEFVEAFPSLREMATKTEGLYGTIPPSPFIAVMFLASADGTRSALVDNFIEGVRTGANLDVGDPRLALRTTIQNAKGSAQGSRVLDPAFVFHVTTRAWNAYVEGRPLAVARYQRSRQKGYVPVDIRGAPRAGATIYGLSTVIEDATNRRVLDRNRA